MAKRPIKVLHVIHWPVSGIVSLFKNIIALMPKDQVESHVIFFYNNDNTISDFSEICSSASSLNMGDSYVRGILRYRRLLHRIGPDIIHTHSFQPMVWGSLLGFGLKRHITTIHNDYPYFREKNAKAFIKRTIQKYLLKICDTKVVAISHRVHSLMQGLKIKNKNLFFIENGIPLTTHGADEESCRVLKKKLAITDGNVVLVTLGRLDIRQKGYDLLLKSFQELHERHKNIVLLFVGDGPDRDKLIGISERLGISDRIRFIGFKKDPVPYLSIADIYVSSSIFEGFALAVAEAALQGLTIVATRVGAVPEIIEHGVSGLLVEPGDSAGMVSALNDLLENRYDLKSMGDMARESTRKKYDINKTVCSYLELYRLTANGTQRP